MAKDKVQEWQETVDRLEAQKKELQQRVQDLEAKLAALKQEAIDNPRSGPSVAEMQALSREIGDSGDLVRLVDEQIASARRSCDEAEREANAGALAKAYKQERKAYEVVMSKTRELVSALDALAEVNGEIVGYRGHVRLSLPGIEEQLRRLVQHWRWHPPFAQWADW
jgi:chromosome segregation ATPase